MKYPQVHRERPSTGSGGWKWAAFVNAASRGSKETTPCVSRHTALAMNQPSVQTRAGRVRINQQQEMPSKFNIISASGGLNVRMVYKYRNVLK